MLIRNEAYKKLISNNKEYSKDEKIKEFDKFGIAIEDVYDLQKISKYYRSEESDTFSNLNFKMKIKDIKNGVDRLIQFYMDKEQIYSIDNVDKTVLNKSDENPIEIISNRTFKVVSNITFEDIKQSLSTYYIPVKYDYQAPEFNDKLAVIDNNIPLAVLNYDFLVSIEELIPNRLKSNIEFNSTRPLLRFKELPIVDVPINLNLSKNELTELVSKLKDDFETGILKNPINILYKRKYNFKEINKVTPFKMTKKSMAEAFFVYDLYQYVDSAMRLHKAKLNTLKQIDVKRIEKEIAKKREESEIEIEKKIQSLKDIFKDNKARRKRYEKENIRDFKILKRNLEKEKEKKLKRINKLYKDFSKDYHAMTVLEELVQDYNISPYLCKQYLKFMRKHIEDLGYKELIIGYAN